MYKAPIAQSEEQRPSKRMLAPKLSLSYERFPGKTGLSQLLARPADAAGMTIEVEYWGGIAVCWRSVDLHLLVDGLGREAWLVWRGRPLGRVVVGEA
jgi:hypothetical protein